MTADEIATATEVYNLEREAIECPTCSYERLVRADVVVAQTASEIERDIDRIRANVPLTLSADASEAKIERVYKDKTIEERHLLRIFNALYTTIKSKQYRETK